jgi:hypothetical protein
MVARKIVVTTQERLRREKCALTVRTPAFQNGTNYQGQPHVRFALEWCTPVTGFKWWSPIKHVVLTVDPVIKIFIRVGTQLTGIRS